MQYGSQAILLCMLTANEKHVIFKMKF